jgi:ArsR family transcriptional regulator
MNIIIENLSSLTGDLLAVLSNPFRIELLYAVGTGEVCVCHLEELLDKRQPYISQHLSVLREAGVLTDRREGRYVFYRVSDLAVFDLLEKAAEIQGIPENDLPVVKAPLPRPGCPCPSCQDEALIFLQPTRSRSKITDDH